MKGKTTMTRDALEFIRGVARVLGMRPGRRGIQVVVRIPPSGR